MPAAFAELSRWAEPAAVLDGGTRPDDLHARVPQAVRDGTDPRPTDAVLVVRTWPPRPSAPPTPYAAPRPSSER
ncbi:MULTISPECIES: hypothetical protein [unclassified Streptomyces]|uniref:hypothetical protein n=1 Tax=unclassified Streptomyces TaxID=2593676 RepID=UPI0023672FD2|nr:MULTISPECIES: hypothetical protein [unclassified Streptomyces]MDF3145479.1 hypothetical protein [Streptomyces sp. T21Q-yed]WDF45001.1 hypothetical protein PBV52_40300 [Streptomyces sp. T12]